MNEYHQPIFYNINKLSLTKRIQLLKDAKNLSYDWRVDEKTVENWARKEIKMSFEDILKKFDLSCYMTVIHRNEYDGEFLEIGFNTMKSRTDYFLWIFIDIQKLDYFIKKYKLKIL